MQLYGKIEEELFMAFSSLRGSSMVCTHIYLITPKANIKYTDDNPLRECSEEQETILP